jgi:ATP-dependent DNA ligase
MLRRVTDAPERKAESIELMECALVPKLPEGSDWTYEIKLDGYRAIGVKGSETILYSRNHKNFNRRFPEALNDPQTRVARHLFETRLVSPLSSPGYWVRRRADT